MADYATINAQDLKKRLDAGEALKLVETLAPEEFEKGHLQGAINIPTDKIEERAPQKLDKDEPIVVYCASNDCTASPKAARKLTEMGYQNVTDFEAGKEGWKSAGYELVT